MQIAGLFTVTVEASLLILLVLFIRRMFGAKLHPGVMKCLWGFPVLRILFPFELPVEVRWLYAVHFPPERVLAWIWLAGAAVCFLLFTVRNRRYGEMLKANSEIYGKKDGVLVYFVDDNIGSCLKGLASPKIYISRLAENSLDWCKWIVKHELSHYRAWDNWYVLLRNLCLIMQWFNPLVWYGAECFAEDCELACDYRVTRGEDKEGQIVYGKCLVAMAARKPKGVFDNMAMGSSLGKGSLKKRIEQLGREKFCPAALEYLLIAVLAAAVLFCFLGPANMDSDVLALLGRTPLFEERIICYEVEDGKQESRDRLLDNIQTKKRCLHEEIGVLPVGTTGVAIIFPGSAYQSVDTAEMLAEDTEVRIESGDNVYRVVLSEEQTIITKDEGGYSIWLEMKDVLPQPVLDENYKVYFGGRLQFEGEAKDIDAGYLRLVEEYNFDRAYDVQKLLTLKNPCGVRRR